MQEKHANKFEKADVNSEVRAIWGAGEETSSDQLRSRRPTFACVYFYPFNTYDVFSQRPSLCFMYTHWSFAEPKLRVAEHIPLRICTELLSRQRQERVIAYCPSPASDACTAGEEEG